MKSCMFIAHEAVAKYSRNRNSPMAVRRLTSCDFHWKGIPLYCFINLMHPDANNGSAMISVSIVDDENKLRQSIAAFLNGSPGFRCLSAYAAARLPWNKLPRVGQTWY